MRERKQALTNANLCKVASNSLDLVKSHFHRFYLVREKDGQCRRQWGRERERETRAKERTDGDGIRARRNEKREGESKDERIKRTYSIHRCTTKLIANKF